MMLYNFKARLDSELTEAELLEFIKKSISEKAKLSKLEIETVFSSKRLLEYSLDELFKLLNSGEKKCTFVVNDVSYNVKLNSHRYYLFRECSHCVCCGLEGTKLFLESSDWNQEASAHFNLYGETDEGLVLMTKDHIFAKTHGGKDVHSNYQTMCSVCNSLKGSCHFNLSQMKRFRIYFDSIKDTSKKQLFNSLETFRKQLKKENTVSEKIELNNISNPVIVKRDLAVFKINDEEYLANDLYAPRDGSLEYIGCIKSGTKLEFILNVNNYSLCKISDNISVRVDNNKHLLSQK